jgi:hypothetical protein
MSGFLSVPLGERGPFGPAGPSFGPFWLVLRKWIILTEYFIRVTWTGEGAVMLYEEMSNEELSAILWYKLPEIAKDITDVNDENRATVIAFLKVLVKNDDTQQTWCPSWRYHDGMVRPNLRPGHPFYRLSSLLNIQNDKVSSKIGLSLGSQPSVLFRVLPVSLHR